MQGFVVVDNQPDDARVAVWTTSRTAPQRASHSHAYVTEPDEPDLAETLASLAYDKAVLLTDGSVADDLPAGIRPMSEADIADLVVATDEHAARIEEAMDDYRRRTGSSPVSPKFPAAAVRIPVEEFVGTETQRALETANFLARAWSAWLATDEQRRRRTVQPQTGESPWMMPEDLSAPQIQPFPDSFLERVDAAHNRP